MGYEARKTNAIRPPEFFDRYFRGRVLDIGAGPDLVVPHAQPFDVEHGDASRILDYLPRHSFDCVHSSHCLEHMPNVRDALAQWWELIRPGGYLVLVVPDEDLYEQGYWPSIYNSDHKATFRLDKKTSWSPVSYDVRELVRTLPSAQVLHARRQDAGYNYSLHRHADLRGKIFLWLSWKRRGLAARLGIRSTWFDAQCDKTEYLLGRPVDQTMLGALAQIEVLAQKMASPADA